MKLEKGIIIHATKEAKKNYIEKKNNRKSSCPSCQIEELKKSGATVDNKSKEFDVIVLDE
jgi:ribosomal protein L37AE/L43A